MSEISERYRRVAAQLTERVEAVPEGAWGEPAPEGADEQTRLLAFVGRQP